MVLKLRTNQKYSLANGGLISNPKEIVSAFTLNQKSLLSCQIGHLQVILQKIYGLKLKIGKVKLYWLKTR